MIFNPKVESCINSIEDLPSLPIVIQQIQKVLSSPKSNMGQISRIIEKDQTLTVRTLRLVNSAYYGLRNTVTSIKDAIIIIGLDSVHNLMLGLSVIKIFKGNDNKIFNHESFWEHSLGCALMSKHIAKKLGYEKPDDCFIAGLLHDIGKLILEQYMHEEYISVLKHSKEKISLLIVQEESELGFNHADIGAFVAMKWKIPTQLIILMKYHHSVKNLPPEFKSHTPVLQIVAKANQICNKHNIGDSMENGFDDDSVFDTLKVKEDEIIKSIDQITSEIKSTLKEWQI